MNLDSITTNNLEEFVDQLETNMQAALDKIAPEMTKNIVARKKVPWFTDEIRAQERTVRRREKIWWKYRQTISGPYSKINRNIQKHASSMQKEVISEKVLQCSRGTEKLYDLMNKIMGTIKENTLPDHTNEEALANKYAEFFLKKIQKIKGSLMINPKHQSMQTVPSEARLTEFKVISKEQVAKIIMNTKTKQCGLETIPIHMIKEALPQIKSSLTKMVNISLHSGQYDKKWKTTLVRPLIKNSI